jgi:DNA (cytosine-5)-methyltransferase 1
MPSEALSPDPRSAGGVVTDLDSTFAARALSDVQHRFTAGELFCGAGGLSRGFRNCGFISRFANDSWDLAVHNFLMNFDRSYARSGGEKRGSILAVACSVEDLDPTAVLRQISVADGSQPMAPGDLDALLGGPPCQGFSVNSHIRSALDPRNFLFMHYVRILRDLAPKVFVLENVPGMFSLEGGQFFDELLSEIGKLNSLEYGGYEIRYRILNAAHYGVPQERFRLVVVGTRRDVAVAVGEVELPEPVHYSLAQAHFKGGRSHTFHYALGHAEIGGEVEISGLGRSLLPPVPVEDAIGDLPPLINGGGSAEPVPYPVSAESASAFARQARRGSTSAANHWARKLLPPNTERVKYIRDGGDWRDIPRELLPPGMQRALRKDHTTRYGRLGRNDLAGTILTKPDPHWGTFIHFDQGQQRLITVREAARLQSFPDVHRFYGPQVDQYRLCGNAVPPLLAEAVARQVREKLEAYYAESGTKNAGLPLVANI